MFSSAAYSRNCLPVYELCQQLIGKGEGGGGSLAGGHLSVDSHQVARIGSSLQCVLEAGIAGGPLPLEYAEGVQHHSGSGTDGGNLPAGLSLGHERLTHALVGIEV